MPLHGAIIVTSQSKLVNFFYWPCWKALNEVVCTFVVSLLLLLLLFANGAI
jgi:hypothetical protein